MNLLKHFFLRRNPLNFLFFFGSIINQSFCQQHLFILYDDGTQNSFSSEFADEFNGSTLATDRWLNSYPWGRHLIGNKPEEETLEYYTDGKNITLHDGILSLVAKKERACGNCESWKDSSTMNRNGQTNYRCFDYSSGMLYSKEAYGYGFYEIRFHQSANSKGLWPAFWLFGNDDEIDIFENKGELKNETHWDLHCKDGCRKDFGNWSKVATDFTNGFNTIGFEWSVENEKWYCNGKNYASTRQPYSGKMHMIATNAVSRNKDKKGFFVGIDATTLFPATLDIDFIRYYKKNYEARKISSKLKNDEAVNLLINSSASVFKNVSVKKRNHQLATFYLDMNAHKIEVNFYGSSANASIAVYDSGGRLFKEKFLNSGTPIIIEGLPDESLVIIARAGRKMFAEKVEARR